MPSAHSNANIVSVYYIRGFSTRQPGTFSGTAACALLKPVMCVHTQTLIKHRLITTPHIVRAGSLRTWPALALRVSSEIPPPPSSSSSSSSSSPPAVQATPHGLMLLEWVGCRTCC